MTESSSYFPDVSAIPYEGPDSANPLAFRWYKADEVVEGKAMRDHFRFSVAFWHTFRGQGTDPFGAATIARPWEAATDSVENSCRRIEAAFEFMQKLGTPFYAFHDRDVAPAGETVAKTNTNLDKVTEVMRQQQERTGVRLLWGTANLFSHPRYMHGAATSCNPEVFAHAAAQVRKSLEITNLLGGANFVFWGGREGYSSLLNTDMKRELDNYARLLHMAVDYAKEIGFEGTLLIEPKPKEPTKHQYDSDAAACINFLRQYELAEHFRLNLETNHATLAGHSMMHEIEYAAIQGMLGSIDANTGDLLLGWDTDQFMTNIYDTTRIMLLLLKHGGLGNGGFNFDAKLRRESVAVEDMFHAHIGSMDAFARGLKIAATIRSEGQLDELLQQRYSGWDSELGRKIESGQHNLESLAKSVERSPESLTLESGHQEQVENLFNRYIS